MINLQLGMTLPQLAPQQERAIDAILRWIRSGGKEFRLAGLAGTGKTTVLAYLYEYLDADVIVASYTGKAVSVLRRRGIESAITLHRLLYWTSFDKRAAAWKHRTKRRIDQHDLVIVDEASMVSDALRAELLTKAHQILWVGDPGQLEPIGDNTSHMDHADFTLDEIHRQARDNPIIRFSHRLRSATPFGFGRLGGLNIFPHAAYERLNLTAYDIVACGRNDTRQRINREIRRQKGYRDVLCLGERIVCLENNRTFHVFNGETFTVAELKAIDENHGHPIIEARIIDDLDKDRGWIPIAADSLGNHVERRPHKDGEGLICDHAQAMTTHKLQASEYDRVLGIDEPPGSCDFQRWRYTMATRAVSHLTYLTNFAELRNNRWSDRHAYAFALPAAA